MMDANVNDRIMINDQEFALRLRSQQDLAPFNISDTLPADKALGPYWKSFGKFDGYGYGIGI